jgi:hypothetical protein
VGIHGVLSSVTESDSLALRLLSKVEGPVMGLTLLQVWKDDGGAVLAVEFILFVVILLFGMIVGYVGLRNAIVAEMTAVADALVDLSVCFSFSGLTNCEASVCGSWVIPTPPTGINTGKTPATNVNFVSTNPCQ